MNVEVIAIGDEILLGSVINTNATFISQELLKIGISVSQHTVLSDEKQTLLSGLESALKRNSLVICTGGLGPTFDDITRETAAELFRSEWYYDESIAEELKSRFGNRQISLKNQATLPKNAETFPNSVGTAPGLVFRAENATLILLPGVPQEMKQMFVGQVAPFLQKQFPQTKKHYFSWAHFTLLPESIIDEALRKIQKKYSSLKIGIYPHQGRVSVRFLAVEEEESSALPILAKARKELCDVFPKNLFSVDDDAIEVTVHKLFVEKGLTLSIAESCTGGALAACITALPGASNYFLGSIVSYSNSLKMDLLAVDKKTIREKGAVSEETVVQMVAGLLHKTGSDYGVAVTGVAGPSGGTKEKPVGSVWVAVAKKGEQPYTWKLQAHGNRQNVITRSVNFALGQLWMMVAHPPNKT